MCPATAAHSIKLRTRLQTGLLSLLGFVAACSDTPATSLLEPGMSAGATSAAAAGTSGVATNAGAGGDVGAAATGGAGPNAGSAGDAGSVGGAGASGGVGGTLPAGGGAPQLDPKLCPLSIVDTDGGLEIRRDDLSRPLTFQHIQPNRRPFQHPLRAPDGLAVLTAWDADYSGGDSHQTALFFAFTGLNGRDYFHHKPARDCWEGCFAKTRATVERREGNPVEWTVTTEWLASDRTTPLLSETQKYALTCLDDHYYLDLRWSGLALADVTIAEAGYGGLFLRTLRHEDKAVINEAGQADREGDGRPSKWIEVSLPTQRPVGTAPTALLLMDHPSNDRPGVWRVDEALQVGSVPSATAAGGNLDIPSGMTLNLRYRLRVGATLSGSEARGAEWTSFGTQ